MGPVIVLTATIGLTWILFILPQQRRIRAHRALVERLEVGDEVMTSSGMYGTISALDEETASLEVAPGTVVRFARGAVARRLADEEVEAPAAPSRPTGTAADRAASDQDRTGS
jgi:preprotein translocase subunit YajC